jgi:hypothetical protein
MDVRGYSISQGQRARGFPHKQKDRGRQCTDAAVAAKFSVLLDLVMTVNAIEKMLVKAIIT